MPAPFETPDGSEYTAGQMLGAITHANLSSMQVVRRFQLGMVAIDELAEKTDTTLLTAVDLESEAVAKHELSILCPNVPILGEESGLSSTADHPYRFMVDPIDGTRDFLNGGPNSTVITSVFNHQTGKFEATAIGEPISGRLWIAHGARNTRNIINPEGSELIAEVVDTHVWDGSHEDNGTVLIDHLQEFSRKNTDGTKRQIMTNPDVVRLFSGIQDKVSVKAHGSNGAHQALVANGGARLAGSITLAMGGEWDAAGVVNVLSAGGVAEGFHMADDRKLEPADPLRPYDYDILVCANNEDTLAFLRRALHNAVVA